MKNYLSHTEQEAFFLIRNYKNVFSIEDMSNLKKIKRDMLRIILHNLSRKKFILRLKKGKYIVREYFLDNPYDFMSKAYEGNIAYLSSLKIHGLIDYEPNTIYIQADISKHKSIESYNFHIINSKYRFGLTQVRSTFTTDQEKTLLDCLMSPKYCDPIILIKAFSEYDFDFNKLLQYLDNINKSSLYQKCGYVISKIYEYQNKKVPVYFITKLKMKIKNKIWLISTPSRSTYDSGWKIMDNVGVENILRGLS